MPWLHLNPARRRRRVEGWAQHGHGAASLALRGPQRWSWQVYDLLVLNPEIVGIPHVKGVPIPEKRWKFLLPLAQYTHRSLRSNAAVNRVTAAWNVAWKVTFLEDLTPLVISSLAGKSPRYSSMLFIAVNSCHVWLPNDTLIHTRTNMPLVFHYISIISPCLLVIPEYQHIKLLENHWTPPQPKHMRGSAGAAWFRRRQSWQHSSSEKILSDPWDLKCKTMQIYIYIYPPTPAYAKAGAAPGTTRGVELGSFVACHGNNGIPTPQAKAPSPHP